MNEFTFIYRGQVRNNASTNQVKSKLAKLFSVDESTWEKVFSGQQYFERPDLNEYTANEYLTAFRQLGAIGEVIDPHTTVTAPAANACPKCNTPKDNEEQCSQCGVYFHKMSSANGNDESSIEDEDDELFDEERHTASKLFNTSTILLVVIFIIDNYLSGRTLAGFSNIDIGYIPYIVAHAFLVYTCAKFADVKGYSQWFGLLGLLSIVGVAIMLLLPDKIHQQTESKLKKVILLLICLATFSYWLIDFTSRQSDLVLYTERATQLVEGRVTFPNKEPLPNSAILSKEELELEQFVADIFNSMNSHDYRPDEQIYLLESAMSAIAQHRLWLNYSRYLTYTSDNKLPTELENKYIQKLEQKLAKMTVADNFDHDELSSLRNQWVSGLSPDDFGSNFGHKLYDYYMEISQMIRFSKMNLRRENQSEHTPTNLESFSFPQFKGSKLTVTNNTLTLTFEKGMLRGQTLVIAVYDYPYKKDPITKKPIYYTAIEPIYASFPVKLLQGDLNPLRYFYAEEF